MMFLGIWFDIALILIALISVLIGYKRGLFSVVKKFRLIFSLFFAWQFKLADFTKSIVGSFIKIDKNYLKSNVERMWGDKIAEAAQNTAVPNESRFDDVFGKLGNLMTGAREYCEKRFVEGTQNFLADVVDYISALLLDFVFATVGFILLFVFFYLSDKSLC